MGGRNRKVAMEMVKTKKVGSFLCAAFSGPALTGNLSLLQSFQELEQELLNGQKLQGALTALEVHQFLDAHGVDNIKRKKKYPLFENVWKICFEVRTTDVTSNPPPNPLTHGPSSGCFREWSHTG